MSLTKGLGRLPFFAAGFALSVLKVIVDTLVAKAFHHEHSLLFYVSPIDAPLFHPSDDRTYWLTLAAVTIPFVAIGIALTARRLVDAAMPASLALFFFVPFANLLFFVVVALAPSRPRPKPLELPAQPAYREPGRPAAPILAPPARSFAIPIAGALGAVVGLGALAVSVGLLGQYGAALTLGAPCMAGFTTGAVLARMEPESPYWRAALATIAACVITLVAIIAFAAEGLGCLAMALPLLVLPAFFGSFLGFSFGKSMPARAIDTTIAGSMLLLVALMGFERAFPMPALHPPPVETSVEIDAPIERVWALLPAMDEMPAPTDWVFSTGIAYPLRARIDRDGVGAKRRCDFTTGPALETVDVWRPNDTLGFTIDEQPDPMVEATLYDTVRQPHLDGYVRNLRGELKVEALPDGPDGPRTRLTGKSWYRVSMTPETYWRLWSDAVIHHIHTRVLAVVKARAEGPLANPVAGPGG
jgi:uncharacterized membrane protein YhaH (DUF805 family)